MTTSLAASRRAAISPQCLSISPLIPLSQDFLVAMLDVAATDPEAVSVWAWHIEKTGADDSPIYLFDEREWDTRRPEAVPPKLRLDIYALTRGLYKCFLPQYQISIAFRQQVLRWLFERDERTMRLMPRVVDQIVQLALFDQVIY